MLKNQAGTLAAICALSVAPGIAGAQNLIYSPTPAEITIGVTVEDIAILTVVQNGSMIIDDASDSTMGNPSSGNSASGFIEPLSSGNWGIVELTTNFDVHGLQFTYPKVDGIRPNPTFHYGEARGAVTDNTLGVWPTLVNIDTDANVLKVIATNQIVRNQGANPVGQLLRRNQTANASGATPIDYANGTHRVAVGVGGNWSNTLPAEPQFAVADTYNIVLTATIIPTP